MDHAPASAATRSTSLHPGTMHHHCARFAIIKILDGSCFGLRALALTQAAMLGHFADIPEHLPQRLLEAAAALPVDRSAITPPGIPGPLPASQEDLCRQILPLVTDRPAQIGFQAAITSALVALWPHAAREERLHLRRAWYTAIVHSRADAGAILDRETLCAWQRDMPTTFNAEIPSPAQVATILDEPTAKGAYHILAENLGPGTDLPTLSWILGSCARQALLRRLDIRGALLQTVVGAVACELLTPFAPCEHLITLLSQLNHQIWWLYRRGDFQQVHTGRIVNDPVLDQAIHDGAYAAAQTAARRIIHDQASFRAIVYAVLDECLTQRPYIWPRALAAIAVTVLRSGPNQISPDDAAATAAVLSTLFIAVRNPADDILGS